MAPKIDLEKERFISEIAKRPALWDKRLQDHRNHLFLNFLWDEVASLFDLTRQEVRTKWKYLVDQFRVHLKNVYHGKPPGSGLDDVIRPRMNTRNFMDHSVDTTHLLMVDETAASHDYTENETTACANEMRTDNRMTTFKMSPKSADENAQSPEIYSAQSTTESNKHTSDTAVERFEDSLAVEHGTKRRKTILNSELSSVLAHELHKVDAAGQFGLYIADLLRQVPEHLQIKCQRSVTNLMFACIEGKIPIVVTDSD